MKNPLNALLPEQLGRNFRWIWSSTAVSNLGDGVLLAAGPLLVASITPEPFAVAMAVFAQRLPWFVFGLFAGAVIDRVDRRALVIWVDIFRGIVLAVLATIVALDAVNLPAIYIAMFLLGSAETLADNAGGALVPAAVPRAGLGRANARLMGTMIVTNQLAGPPIGAFMFGVGLAYPFGFNAICFAAAVALISKVRFESKFERPQPLRSVRTEVTEGLKWLWANAPVRTLAVMITAFNITFGAAFSIWVLYAYERLGLDEVGFGTLLAATAVGGMFGSIAFGWLERRFSYTALLRAGLVIETFTHLGLALTTSFLVAGLIMVMFGAHAIVWGTTSTTVRQRLVPHALLGRVTSVYLIGGVGALAIGSLLGGAIAQRWGVTAPFWFAFVGSAVILVLTWGSIAHLGRADDGDDDGAPALGSSLLDRGRGAAE